VPFGYQPLWPFANLADVEAWQNAYRSGGHQPWHLDADATALAFTTGYLKFAGINVVVWRSIQGNEALVAVGYPIGNRAPGTAAVLHLAKFGTGTDAPWEVVGSKDTTLTLTQPGYGARVRSPVTVGGTITGVDESIRVQVHQPSSEQPIGQTDGLPAGGENTPWSTTVTYQGATAPALTIVASTGGHYTDVERFAITGIRPAA
jgi:acyl dehydratase